MKMKIHQLVHTLNYGDAISGEALSIKHLLVRRRIESRIFALHAHPNVKDEAETLDGLVRELNETVNAGAVRTALILHYSIGSPLNPVFLEARNTRRIVIYHNLTPASWYCSYNPRVARDLEAGLVELPDLMKQADLVLADSEFNRHELQESGVPDVRVLPLLVDHEKWSVAANAGIAAALRGHGGTNLLFVGRLAPNKCVEDVIKAFYFYHFKIAGRSRLWIVGSDVDNEIYSFELRRLVAQLGLREAVAFVGTVADSELRAFYENSDVYISMSEHEGFCVPLLEAMFFGLPVIAYAACAVPDTVGDGGFLIREKAPEKLAELIDLVIKDPVLRQRGIDSGRAQAEKFGSAAFERSFEALVLREFSTAD